MLEETKRLLASGMSVIPVKGRAASAEDEWKRPAVNWKPYQTRRPSVTELEEWFKASQYNLAIVTGPVSNVIVLDVDERHGGVESLRGKFLPKTRTVKTPNGYHYYFRWTPALAEHVTTVASVLPGVDIRGVGGYVIAPPSVGFKGGSYQWVNDRTVPALPPPWLIELLKKGSASAQGNPSGWIAETLTNMSEGNRNNSFAKVAGKLRYAGWGEEDIYQVLKPKAEELEFPLEELRTVAQSIAKKDGKEIQASYSLKDFLAVGEAKTSWLVDGVIPQESVSILGGMQGLGKTWLLLDLAIELARGGGNWLDRYLVNPARVLYIDEESNPQLFKSRLRKLLSGKGLKDEGLLQFNISLGHGLNFSDLTSVAGLKSLIADLQPEVVIVDSLIRVHKANENSATEMSGVFQEVQKIVREFKCSFIFADHEHKGIYHKDEEEAEPSSNDLRGSNEKAAFADCVLSLKKRGGELFLYHTKARHAEAQTPVLVKIEDDETKTKTSVRGF